MHKSIRESLTIRAASSRPVIHTKVERRKAAIKQNGAKDLEVWLSSRYCLKRGITAATVSTVVKLAIVRRPSVSDGYR